MLINTFSKKIIIKKHKVAKTPFSQVIGLMFKRKSKFNYALVFPRPSESITGSALHMFFVFFTINVIFLNEKKNVVDIKRHFKPFCFYAPKKKAKYIIELPLFVDISKVKIGNKLTWK